MLHVSLQIILLRLLYSEFAETCDQPKRDRAASQSQRAEKPVPASHARLLGTVGAKGQGALGGFKPPSMAREAA